MIVAVYTGRKLAFNSLAVLCLSVNWCSVGKVAILNIQRMSANKCSCILASGIMQVDDSALTYSFLLVLRTSLKNLFLTFFHGFDDLAGSHDFELTRLCIWELTGMWKLNFIAKPCLISMCINGYWCINPIAHGIYYSRIENAIIHASNVEKKRQRCDYARLIINVWRLLFIFGCNYLMGFVCYRLQA